MRPPDEQDGLLRSVSSAAGRANAATDAPETRESPGASTSEGFDAEVPTAPNRHREAEPSVERAPAIPAGVGAYRLVRPCPSESISAPAASERPTRRVVLGVAGKRRRSP